MPSAALQAAAPDADDLGLERSEVSQLLLLGLLAGVDVLVVVDDNRLWRPPRHLGGRGWGRVFARVCLCRARDDRAWVAPMAAARLQGNSVGAMATSRQSAAMSCSCSVGAFAGPGPFVGDNNTQAKRRRRTCNSAAAPVADAIPAAPGVELRLPLFTAGVYLAGAPRTP